MTLRYEDFSGGTADEAAITNANTNFSSVFGSPVFDTAQVYGTGTAYSMRSPGSGYGRWDGINNAAVGGSFYYRQDTSQTGTRELIHLRTSGSVKVGSIAVNASDRIVCTDSADAVVAASNIAGHAITNNTWWRIDWLAQIGAGTGRWQYRIVDVDPTDNDTPIATFDSGAALSMGSTNIDRVYVGFSQDPTVAGNSWFAHPRAEDGRTTYMGGLFIPAGPTQDSVWVNVGGVWKQGTFWVKASGVWHEAPAGA